MDQTDYEAGLMTLEIAIREYDQAIADLTASLVAGIPSSNLRLTMVLDMHFQQLVSQRHTRDQGFFEWLSPSFWLVEAQLCALRSHRHENTLSWVKDLQQFSDWRTCTTELNDEHRILWLTGRPGVGKSIISAYLVDFIRCLYPTSNVAYFFCKRGQSGLTSVVDIIRTFAHNLSAGNTKIRSVLQGLRDSGFGIEENLGVHLLFQKLVAEAVALSETDTYVVLDGIDEVDIATEDKIGDEPQIDTLIRLMAALPNTKIIFTSQPNVAALATMTSAVKFSITSIINQTDIRTYVTQILQQSPRLQRQFERQGIIALDYFQEYSNGIFLWVTSAIQALLKCQSKSTFEQCIGDFRETSGVMDGVYSIILSKIDMESRRWIKEILVWLIIADEGISDEELKAAVRASLGDEHDDWQLLLESSAGSILETIEDHRGSSRIQIIHETFRSFITDVERCGLEWVVEGPAGHGRLVRTCVNILCSENPQPQRILRYAGSNWVRHLLKIDFTPQYAQRAVIDIHRLIISKGIRTWIEFGMRHTLYFLRESLEGSDEVKLLQSIVTWYSTRKMVWPSPDIQVSNDSF
jgi:hypothetical protein